ncbi:MAG: [FeFe] hydrogenase, group A, partial [bacterium]|nr:[FeFe] hydrogenase, group A [bacterium]
MVSVSIDGYPVKVPGGTSILDAARKVQINIPTLCKHPDLPPTAACGICVVKVQPAGRMLRACCTPVEEGMAIITNDGELNEVRRAVLHLILSAHPNDCLRCGRNGTCELQKLAEDFAVRHEYFPNISVPLPKDDSTGAVVLDPQKCVKCGRCLDVCQRLQNVWALSFLERGIHTRMAAAGEISLADSPCVRCGQCAAHCPTGAIFEYDHTSEVWEALRDPQKYCVVQIAPAVRTSLGEAFGYKPGELLTGKIYAILRRLGFKAVFDTNFGADVTIMEEAAELVERLTQGKGVLPMITTCCPSWVDYMEKFHHDMIPHFSSCKSPQAIVGVLAKTYFAQAQRIEPDRIYMVSVMPCTAKKYEIRRNEDMAASGYADVDVVLTTRELARMIKQAGIDFQRMGEELPDSLLGNYTGAGTIFGVTGGVMEAALRTAHAFLTGGSPPVVEFTGVRGLK